MSDRLLQLQKLLEKEPNDTFLLYGVAMEYKNGGQPEPALEHLRRVVAADGSYCYAYHQMGLVYESLDDLDSARRAYREGIESAKKKGDDHARQEIEGALMLIE